MSELRNSAMLADFSASQWTARKVDKAQTSKLTEANKAHEKAAHVSKKLIMADTLQRISALVTSARDEHKRLTSPWLDNGARILSVAMHSTYMETMERKEAEFWPLVETFVRNYPAYIEHAQNEHVALGRLFNADDYPKASRIRDKFAWRQSIFALPDATDFRVDIGESALKRVKAQITATVNQAAENAVRDVLERAHDVVSAMCESLAAFDPEKTGKERGIFRDSLVGNIRKLVDIMPGLNFSGDTRVSLLADKLKALVEHDGETLRASDNIRAGVLASAMDVNERLAKALEIASDVSDFMA